MGVLLHLIEQRVSVRFQFLSGSTECPREKLESNGLDSDASEVVSKSIDRSHRVAAESDQDFYISEGRVCLLCGGGRVIVLPTMSGLG